MTTTFLHPAMIAIALVTVLVLFYIIYTTSERDLWDKLLYGSVTICWSSFLIAFIFEQWIR